MKVGRSFRSYQIEWNHVECDELNDFLNIIEKLADVMVIHLY